MSPASHHTPSLDSLAAGVLPTPTAWAALCEAGNEVCALAIERLPRARHRNLLVALLGELDGDEVTPQLGVVYADRDFRAARAATEALGLRADRAAATILAKPPRAGPTQAWIDALCRVEGESAPDLFTAALEPMWRMVEEGRCAELGLFARGGAGLSALSLGAVADVRLGNLRSLPRLYSVALLGIGQDAEASALARELTLIALRSAAAPGLVSLFEAVVRKGGEAAELAVTAWAGLGRPEDVPRLLRFQKRAALAGRVHTGIRAMIGDEPPLPIERAWWAGNWAERLTPGVCHLRGLAATPGPHVEATRAGGDDARDRLRELTGLPWLQTGLPPRFLTPRESSLLDEFWPARAADFPPGKLHRWGRSHDPSVVDGPLPELPDLRRG